MSAFLFDPIDKWQHVLSQTSKTGLLCCIDQLLSGCPYDRDYLLKMAEANKRLGRSLDAGERYERYKADPEAEAERWHRRKLAALKAAKRRKQNKNRRAA